MMQFQQLLIQIVNVVIAYNKILMQTIKGNFQESPCKNKDRVSGHTACSEDSFQSQANIFLQVQFIFEQHSYANRFNAIYIQNQMGTKLNAKAVQWLISVCWDQGLDHQGLWLSIGLFYIYCSRKQIKKSTLEKLLSGILLISSKLTKSQTLSVTKILELTKNKYTSNDLIEMEFQILQLVEFDLHFQHLLTDISLHQKMNVNLKNQFFCVAEILLLKNSNVFWDNNMCIEVLKILKKDYKQITQKSQQLRDQIKCFAKSKEGNTILRKYDSVIDTHNLLLKIQN